MKTNQGTILFLLASFISSLGDYVLLYAVPAGLGLETADIRSAVSMWLIPAVAMYLSSYLSRFVSKRELTSRTDLGRLYLAIGVLEIIFAILVFFCTSKLQVLITVCFFVFFYAFAKEGIPKLFYMVSIYRYFVSATQYTKLASTNAGLGVLASILGTLFAGGLLATGNWKFGLLVDAITFFIFGTIILFYGSDIKSQEEVTQRIQDSAVSSDTAIALNRVYLILPVFFCINAISWNYFPLLVQSLDIASVANSVYFIALLRTPGLILGLRYTTIFKNLRKSSIIAIVGFFYFLSIFAFLISPSKTLFAITILAQGLFSGVYWPTDLATRNQLGSKPQILFNTSVLKSLSSFQFIGCLLALLLFADTNASMAKLPIIFVGISAFILAFQSYKWRQINQFLDLNPIKVKEK